MVCFLSLHWYLYFEMQLLTEILAAPIMKYLLLWNTCKMLPIITNNQKMSQQAVLSVHAWHTKFFIGEQRIRSLWASFNISCYLLSIRILLSMLLGNTSMKERSQESHQCLFFFFQLETSAQVLLLCKNPVLFIRMQGWHSIVCEASFALSKELSGIKLD